MEIGLGQGSGNLPDDFMTLDLGDWATGGLEAAALAAGLFSR